MAEDKTMTDAAVAPKNIATGMKVRVTQQIPQRDEVWTTQTEGYVVRLEQKKTGSWYAHAKDEKLWLDRLILQRDDGEIIVLNLDRYSVIEIIDETINESVKPRKTYNTEIGGGTQGL